jgi:hypothetical protein
MEDWLQEIWRVREEEIYPQIFGPLPDKVLPLPIEAILGILGERPVDPRWLRYAVIEIEPNKNRPDWVYVTDALSTPWNIKESNELDPNGMSGMGFEMMLRTSQRSGWAVDILHRLMAYQIGVAYDILKGRLFNYGDWMPLNGPISHDYPTTPVRGILMTRPLDLESQFKLPSGKVDLLQIVGITGNELAYLLQRGPDTLVGQLYDQKAAPITNPGRAAIKLNETFTLSPELAKRF